MSDSDSEASDSDDSKAASDTDSLAWDLTMKAQTSPVLLDSEFDPENQSLVSPTLDNQSSPDSKNKSTTTNNTPLVQVDTKQIKQESPTKGNRRPGEGISSIPVQSKQIAMNESSSSSSSKKTPQVPPLPKAVPSSSSSSDTSLNNKIIQSNEDRTRGSKSTGVRSETTNSSQKTTMNDGMKPVTFSQKFLFPSLEEVSHSIILFCFVILDIY